MTIFRRRLREKFPTIFQAILDALISDGKGFPNPLIKLRQPKVDSRRIGVTFRDVSPPARQKEPARRMGIGRCDGGGAEVPILIGAAVRARAAISINISSDSLDDRFLDPLKDSHTVTKFRATVPRDRP